jgi:hypothetical protein
MDRLDRIISKLIKEATGDGGGGRGSYIPPIQPGLRPWSGESLHPFTQSVSDYKNPLVQYDSYDKTWKKCNHITKKYNTMSGWN